MPQVSLRCAYSWASACSSRCEVKLALDEVDAVAGTSIARIRASDAVQQPPRGDAAPTLGLAGFVCRGRLSSRLCTRYLECMGDSSSGGDAELAEDVAQVRFDGLLAEEQLGGDLAVGLACGNQLGHL
jgi:hypothetical protein